MVSNLLETRDSIYTVSWNPIISLYTMRIRLGFPLYTFPVLWFLLAIIGCTGYYYYYSTFERDTVPIPSSSSRGTTEDATSRVLLCSIKKAAIQ